MAISQDIALQNFGYEAEGNCQKENTFSLSHSFDIKNYAKVYILQWSKKDKNNAGICIFVLTNRLKNKRLNKGGRPRTGREKSVTVRLSADAIALLNQEQNKSELIDSLILGKVARLQCPKCGGVITLTAEDLL